MISEHGMNFTEILTGVLFVNVWEQQRTGRGILNITADWILMKPYNENK